MASFLLVSLWRSISSRPFLQALESSPFPLVKWPSSWAFSDFFKDIWFRDCFRWVFRFSAFVHEQLPGDRYIRLLRIAPGSDRISVAIDAYLLDTLPVEYEALSYTWGPAVADSVTDGNPSSPAPATGSANNNVASTPVSPLNGERARVIRSQCPSLRCD